MRWIKGALARVLDEPIEHAIPAITVLQHGGVQESNLVWRKITFWRGGEMFHVPVKPSDPIAERGRPGHNAIEVGRVLLRFQQTFPPAGRGADEEGTAHWLVVKRLGDGFTCYCADVHGPKQEIVLFGLIIEGPTGIPRI